MFALQLCVPIVFAIVAELVADMKSNGIKKSTFRIAFCGVLAALSLVLMLLTSLIPIGTFAFPCFAGMLTAAIVIEYGGRWAIGVYAVVSVLAAFFAGDKEAVLYFIALFGYYPVLKGIIEGKIKNKLVQYLLKFSVFNAAAVGSFFAATFLLSIPAEEFEIFGLYLPWVFLIAGNLFFVLYDYAVSVLVTQYIHRLRNKLFKKL